MWKSVSIKYSGDIELIKIANNIYLRRSTGLSGKKIINPYESDTNFSPELVGSTTMKTKTRQCIFSS